LSRIRTNAISNLNITVLVWQYHYSVVGQMFISDRVNIAWPSSATATTVRKEPESWVAVSECMMSAFAE